jgi:hypothetical protein
MSETQLELLSMLLKMDCIRFEIIQFFKRK